MRKASGKRKKSIFGLLAAAALLTACHGGETAPAESNLPEPTPAPAPGAAETVAISELMEKNRATLRAEDGSFPDWIELVNEGEQSVSLAGFRIADSEGEDGWQLPDVSIPAGGYLLLFADGGDSQAGLHTDFSLSEGETVCLYNAEGVLLSQAFCGEGEADISLTPDETGAWTACLYPTPGSPNTAEYYELRQQSMGPEGPLCIQRVCVANQSGQLDGVDWVELRNLSEEELSLSGYYLSDDGEDYRQYALPDKTLKPGKSLFLRCDDTEAGTGFSLDSSNDQLYLSNKAGKLLDYVSLKNIPYGSSFGRIDGGSGWYYIEGTRPDRPGRAFRRVSEMPRALEADGVYNGVDSITVTLSGSGTIHYTLDSSLPTEASPVYEGPLTIRKTGIVRAICVEEGAMPSRALTLSYIINENHSLPVLSLVSDNSRDFRHMYDGGKKDLELPGSLSLYEEDGGFTIPCGIKMHGETSLILPKKNMSVRFRGSYGQEELHYDVYDGGVTSFTNFVLRAGQDYYHGIIRNELCQNLCLKASDHVISQRSKYCILYMDGQYHGIYALMEKPNEQHYANLAGVSRDSVTVEQAKVASNTALYQEVFRFCYENDMSDPENYREFCSRMDVDSLIDWLIIEGVCANRDLSVGNLRYCRSVENDGLWRLMFYDLDASFHSETQNFYNVLHSYPLNFRQYGTLVNTLLVNEDFVDRLLNRAAELLETELSNEKILAEIDRLSAEVAPEVERDYARYGFTYEKWEWNIAWMKELITHWDWQQHSIDAICELLELSDEQRQQYFG